MNRILAIIALSASVSWAGEPDKTLHQKCIYPAVTILNQPSPQHRSVGSGVIIKTVKGKDKSENYVFTCAHILEPVLEPVPPADPKNPDKSTEAQIDAIVDGKEKYNIKVQIGVYEDWSLLLEVKDYEGEVLFVDRKKDIGLVRFVTEGVPYVADVDQKPKLFLGNEVCRVGSGMGEPFRLDFGRITAVVGSVDVMLKDTYRTSIQTVQGDSGGPVFHENKLIGVMQAVRATGGPFGKTAVYHMSYVIPIRRFYESEQLTKLLGE